jgi:hypothetical protein
MASSSDSQSPAPPVKNKRGSFGEMLRTQQIQTPSKSWSPFSKSEAPVTATAEEADKSNTVPPPVEGDGTKDEPPLDDEAKAKLREEKLALSKAKSMGRSQFFGYTKTPVGICYHAQILSHTNILREYIFSTHVGRIAERDSRERRNEISPKSRQLVDEKG